MERLAVCRDQIGVVEKARQQPPRMHRLDEAEDRRSASLANIVDAEIGDEAVAEIGDGHVGDIFGDRLDDGHHYDGGGDPVDHLLVLRHEHVVGGLLDEEGNGASGRRGEDHGDAREQQAGRCAGANAPARCA